LLRSTAIFGAVDTALMMRRDQDGTRVMSSRQRYGTDMPDSILTLDEATRRIGLGTSGTRPDAAVMHERVLLALDTPMEESLLRSKVAGDNNLAARALRDLVDDGRVERSGGGKRGDPYVYARAPRGDDRPD
jgi:hypothetical protein